MNIDFDRFRCKWKIENDFLIAQSSLINRKINLKQVVCLFHPEDKLKYGITFYCNNDRIHLGYKSSPYDDKTFTQIKENIKNITAQHVEESKKLLSNYKLDVDNNYNEIPFCRLDTVAIAYDILDKLKNKQIIINDEVEELDSFWQKLIISEKENKNQSKQLSFIEIIKSGSIQLCADYAISSGLNNYGITKIISSSNEKFKSGEYFYTFDNNRDLLLLELPLIKIEFNKYFYYGKESEPLPYSLTIYNPKKIRDIPIILKQDMIFDYDLDGTQVSLTQSSKGEDPDLIKTMFSEFLFGSSYATITGLSNSMPKIESKVEDLRTIQIVLNDNSDIRFQGISIYYDLKRYMGNQKNKRIISEERDYRADTNSISTSNITKQIEDIKNLKELLDLNIITQEEFDLKKKNILGI